MQGFSKEIRTPEKHLLVGIVSKEDGHLYLVVKNRGKVDRIAIEILLANIYPNENSTLNQNNPTKAS